MRSGKQNSGSVIPEDFNGSVEDYISLVFDHQKLCQKEGKYIEADLAKKKLGELKSHLQNKVKQEMKERHKAELSQVQKAHAQQFGEFNQYWDTKIQQYQQEALRIDEQIRNRHQEELLSFEKQIQESLNNRSKQTSEIINLRKIQENLAKIQNYQQAHKVQQQIIQLQKVQFEKWNITKSTKLKNLLSQLQTKQQTQLKAIRQKIEVGYQLQKKARLVQLQKLMQKYNNFIKELNTQHHQQITRLQKSIKNQSFLSASVSKASSTMSKALTNKNK